MISNCLNGNHFKKITYQQIVKSPAGAFLVARAYQEKSLYLIGKIDKLTNQKNE